MTKSSASIRQSKQKRISSIREAIAKVEQEECSCRVGGLAQCARCEHLEELDAQLQEVEG